MRQEITAWLIINTLHVRRLSVKDSIEGCLFEISRVLISKNIWKESVKARLTFNSFFMGHCKIWIVAILWWFEVFLPGLGCLVFVDRASWCNQLLQISIAQPNIFLLFPNYHRKNFCLLGNLSTWRIVVICACCDCTTWFILRQSYAWIQYLVKVSNHGGRALLVGRLMRSILCKCCFIWIFGILVIHWLKKLNFNND